MITTDLTVEFIDRVFAQSIRTTPNDARSTALGV
jgi:hypothetical protein